jgi:hypothetical protein
MPDVKIRAIDSWPDPPTPNRRRAPFKASESATMALLERELRMIGAKYGVLELVLDSGGIRLDGQLKARANPTHPGVILNLETRHGPLRYACDTFSHYTDNIRAVALTLEALRKVDRYGSAKRGEQYRGWAQLPPGDQPATLSHTDAERIIREAAGEAYQHAPLGRAIRAAIRNTHPDTGGDAQHHRDVIAARDAIEASR